MTMTRRKRTFRCHGRSSPFVGFDAMLSLPSGRPVPLLASKRSAGTKTKLDRRNQTSIQLIPANHCPNTSFPANFTLCQHDRRISIPICRCITCPLHESALFIPALITPMLQMQNV